MPVTFPNISIEEAKELLQIQDRVLRASPRSSPVMGKAGRAETPTDNAPLSMFRDDGRAEAAEQVALRNDAGEARSRNQPLARDAGHAERAHHAHQGARRHAHDGHPHAGGHQGIRADLAENERVGREIEDRLRTVPGTRSVFAERETSGLYVDFEPDRKAIGPTGMRVMDVMDIVETAIGGMVIDRTVEGRERFTVNVRYPRELRTDLPSLERVLVTVRLARPERTVP